MLLVDGSHRFVDAVADIDGWGARVGPCGVMLLHDAFSSVGVTAAIACRLLTSSRWRYRGRTGSLATYTADLDGTPRSRLRNAARQCLEMPWFVRNLALKGAIRIGAAHLARRLGRRPPEWPY